MLVGTPAAFLVSIVSIVLKRGRMAGIAGAVISGGTLLLLVLSIVSAACV